MIIMIIAIAFLMISIIGFIVFIIKRFDLEIPAGLSAIFFGITLILGITQMVANFPSSVATLEYQLKEKVNLFQFDKQILESYHLVNEGDKSSFTSDITFEVISTSKYYEMIRDYNDEVFDFKCGITRYKNNRNNPWISWFVNPAYLSITDDMLNELTYSIGK